MTCRLCEIDKPLIKAHILPEGFYQVLSDDSGVPEILTNTQGAYPKRSPVGVYDKSILCRECDNSFSPWDEHAQKVLLHEFSDEIAIYDGPRKIAWRIQRFDYRRIKLFFLSLLWRASVSTHAFYSRVSAGRFERKLRDMLRAGDPGAPDDFAVSLARFDDPRLTGMLDPHADRYDGIKYYRFYIAGFVAYIKVDRRPPPPSLTDFVVRDNMPIIVLMRASSGSKDTAVMRDIARRAWALKSGR